MMESTLPSPNPTRKGCKFVLVELSPHLDCSHRTSSSQTSHTSFDVSGPHFHQRSTLPFISGPHSQRETRWNKHEIPSPNPTRKECKQVIQRGIQASVGWCHVRTKPAGAGRPFAQVGNNIHGRQNRSRIQQTRHGIRDNAISIPCSIISHHVIHSSWMSGSQLPMCASQCLQTEYCSTSAQQRTSKCTQRYLELGIRINSSITLRNRCFNIPQHDLLKHDRSRPRFFSHHAL